MFSLFLFSVFFVLFLSPWVFPKIGENLRVKTKTDVCYRIGTIPAQYRLPRASSRFGPSRTFFLCVSFFFSRVDFLNFQKPMFWSKSPLYPPLGLFDASEGEVRHSFFEVEGLALFGLGGWKVGLGWSFLSRGWCLPVVLRAGIGPVFLVWGTALPRTSLLRTALRRTAQIFALFPLSRHNFHSSPTLLGVFSWNFGGLFENPALKRRRLLLVWWSRQPENSKCPHFRAPALQTPPKFHEKGRTKENCGWRGKKVKFWPSHPLGLI